MNQSPQLLYIKMRQLKDAIAFFKDRLGMTVEENVLVNKEKCILVKPHATNQILISKNRNQKKPGQVILNTADCLEDYCRFKAKGIVFKKAPVYLSEGLCAIFSDPFGNDYTLLEQRSYSEF